MARYHIVSCHTDDIDSQQDNHTDYEHLLLTLNANNHEYQAPLTHGGGSMIHWHLDTTKSTPIRVFKAMGAFSQSPQA